MKMMALAFALSGLAAPAFAADTVVYNTAPTTGWQYGDGNDYTPANTAVLKFGTAAALSETALRMHQTYVPAPASDSSGVYSFALGTTPINFDWAIDTADSFDALITLTNIGTGQSVSYNPFFAGNDNETFGNSVQNSFKLDCYGYCPGLFTPLIDSTYKVNLTVTGSDGAAHSLDVFAKLGAGAGAVPEPQSWAMLLLGFGLVGAAMRRQPRTAVRAASHS